MKIDYYSKDKKKFVKELVLNGSKVTPATEIMCEHFNIPYNEKIGRNYRSICQIKGITNNTTVEETEDFKLAQTRNFDKTKNRFIISWGQSETGINENFLTNIEAYAKHIDAGIHIICGRYKSPTSLSASKEQEKKDKNIDNWHPRLRPYLDANRQNLHKHLVLLADVKIQPTAITPLTGFNSVTGLESCIIGHPHLHLKSLPILDGYPNKLLLTTGAVTVPNYSDSKVGKKADFHHSLGFVVVELDEDNFHIRQVQCDNDGSFYDLIYHIEDGLVEISNEDYPSIVFGDLHLGEHSEEVVELAFKIATRLRASEIILHDVMNGHSVSSHDLKDPFVLLKREEDGSSVLQTEIDYMVKWFNDRRDFNFVSVMSNHNDWIDRWIRTADFRKTNNKRLYLELGNVVAKGLAEKGLVSYLLDTYTENVLSLGYDDSYRKLDWELGRHFDKGANGSRGSVMQFKNLNTKTIGGHGHCMPSNYLVQTKDGGWKELRAIKIGEEVLSYDYKTGNNVWNVVEDFIKNDYDGIMLRIQGNGFEQTFTSEHNLMLKDGSYIKASQAICSRSASELPISALPVIGGGIEVPEHIIKMIVAIAADGSQDEYRIRFHLKKERKIERLKSLFGNYLKIYNSSNSNFNGVISTRSEIYKEIKKYKPNLSSVKNLTKDILSWSTNSLSILEEELRHWDGTYDTGCEGRQYTTSNKCEANIVSSVVTRLGYSTATTIKTKQDTNHKTIFVITWCKDRNSIKNSEKLNHDVRFNGWGFRSYQSKLSTYCLTVENSCFWVKSPKTGQVSLTGNSPERQLGCIMVGTLTKLKLGYNSGLSSWMQGIVVIYPNGKASNIHFIKNKFTTLFAI